MPATRRKRRPAKQAFRLQQIKHCRYCDEPILKHFADHETICGINSANRKQALADLSRRAHRNTSGDPAPVHVDTSSDTQMIPEVEDADMELGFDADGPSPSSPAASPDTCDPPSLPRRFIYVKHHPHAHKEPEIISLDDEASQPESSTLSESTDDRPWAPFRSYHDHKFASRCVKRRMPNAQINEDLRDLRSGAFSTDCLVSFRTHADLDKVVEVARLGNVQFESQTFHVDFDGKVFSGRYKVDIELRDAWKIIKRWITDETLAPVSTWFSQERYLCLNGQIDYSNPLYDEPCTGETWREIDDSLPDDPSMPSCYLGLHVWLDKGLVSTKVKMHPILLRGSWIHSTTRNGSGNGGSTLVGFPPEIAHIDPKNLKSNERSDYDRIKRLIYREVCRRILASIKDLSHTGEALRFGDGVVCFAHPGVLIESMDLEELAAWLTIRNSRSLHPCPQCLVHHDDLPDITRTFPKRTTQGMVKVVRTAPNSSATARNEHFKKHGLHDFKHFLWEFKNSDAYGAASLDKLHVFDGGVWGRHLWKVIVAVLQKMNRASEFNENFDNLPRWRDLAHLSAPTTIDYSEGETFLTILKCALPCLVQLMPNKSCLVRVVRIMQKINIMLGLEVATKTRLDLLDSMIAEYESICLEINDEFGKDFRFLKQHMLSHASADIRAKGATRNTTTRVGEGFQQEVSAMYKKTNGKRAEHQISVIDEKEETLAYLDMKVDA
ncbi:hypothetical protein FB45DRAFT_1019687 [Roridomyces roridus]|uniref:Transposase n=1 Tax=Roridomyces roridus TaxID=1738132 RepID=A0AAD7CFG6_9AGAR|nr:hypothetical protein FB45DRAFT_1019687 [Roridomyces roridus]